MTLEESISRLCNEATAKALNTHLPTLLERLVLPPDGNTRHSIKEAAQRLRIPESTLKQRIREGEIKVVADGKYKFILEDDLAVYNRKLRDRERFRRDQTSKLSSDVPTEIRNLLEPKAKAA